MGTHPLTVLEERLRRSQALAKAAVAELEVLRLPETWALAELLDGLEETLTDVGLALKASVRRVA